MEPVGPRHSEVGKIVIAIINGVCAGAGLSVALSCDLLYSQPKVRFVSGFAQIGLVPDAGSSHILLHTLGYQKALAFFLSGKPLMGEELLEVGLVNYCGSDAHDKAMEMADVINQLAPLSVVEIKKIFSLPLATPAKTPSGAKPSSKSFWARHMIIKRESRPSWKTANLSLRGISMTARDLKSVVVFGAGTMGRGIAQWMAQQSLNVVLVDVNHELAVKALEAIHKSWDALASKNKFDQNQVSQFKKSLLVKTIKGLRPKVDLAIEAIYENFDAKVELLKNLDDSLPPEAILATNTSSFSIDSLAKNLAPLRKKNFLGLHFFNPAPIMKLVEVVQGQDTSSSLVDFFCQWFEEHGKKPAHCHDSPGFIVNRVARNFYGEAMRIVKSDDESKYLEVDRVMKKVGGFRMGPFELIDLIGVDINFQVGQSVWNSYFQEPRFAPHPLQKKLVDSNRLGKKSKRGFYSYE